MSTVLAIVLKLVSIIFLAIFILSVVLLIITLRQPKKVSVLSLILSIAISLLCLVIFSTLIRYEPQAWVWFVMGAIGIGIGIFWSRSTSVFASGDRVMSKNSIWYLAVWGGVFAVNQLITIVTNRPPDIAMAMLIMSTTMVWGTNGSIMRRYYRMKSTVPAQSSASQISGATAKRGNDSLTIPETVTTTETDNSNAGVSATCPGCGAPKTAGASFCMKCGKRL